jgi:serine/threonine protein phosphatase PrpC
VSSAPDSDRASQAAVDAALAQLLSAAPVADAIAHATTAAQAAACLLAPKTGSVPSCTYVAAVVQAGHTAGDTAGEAGGPVPGVDAPASCVVTVAWVGDSRAYLVDRSGARRLTSDDSWAQDVVDAGEMTEAQAMVDPRAHQITRWLGADAVQPVVARTAEVTVTGQARLLVCSDGLWNELSSDADLVGLGTLDDRALVTARRLVDHANAAGGRDNITVALIDLPWPVPTASPPEEPT